MRAIFIKRIKRQYEKLAAVKKEAEAEGMIRVARRCHGIMLNMETHTAPGIAELFHVSRAQVSKWIRDYLKDGIESVYEGYRPGAPLKMNEVQKKQLRTMIGEGPLKHGLETGVWTSTNIAEVIRRKFSVTYHPGHVRKLLHAIGCSVQRPRSRNYKADSQKREEWLEKTYPNIQKKRWYRMQRSSSRMKQASNSMRPSTEHGE